MIVINYSVSSVETGEFVHIETLSAKFKHAFIHTVFVYTLQLQVTYFAYDVFCKLNKHVHENKLIIHSN